MPKFTKAYSFGLVTGLPYIVMEPTIRLLNDQRVQRGRAAQGAFTWSDFFPQFFFSTFQNWQSGSATRLAKRPGLAMFYLGFVAPGRATTDLKPRSTDRLLSEESTKPSSAIRRKKKSRAAA